MNFSRRTFLSASATAAAAVALNRLVARNELFTANGSGYANLTAGKGAGAYGALQPTAANNTGEKLLALPEGFQYNVFGKVGEKQADGRTTPGAHDGMATFQVKGELRLIRNHEVNNGIGREGVTIGDPGRSYDAMAGGGTTTLVIDARTRELKRSFVSLSGTLQNCAGGLTPWGSWVSCEETILGKQKLTDSQGRERGGFAQEHGYCFEVFAKDDELKKIEPIKAMGRFVHEAIAVDPKTGIVYETEDIGSAGLYRFLPNQKGKLAEGGRLQMLAVREKPNYDARTGQKQGAPLAATWVDISDPDPASAATDPLSVYKQGQAKGAATFARLEGIWYGAGSIYFTSTNGGAIRRGQVWRYTPGGKDDGLLSLMFETPDVAVLDGPDNLCVSPRGGLVICEDGIEEQFMRGLTADGRIFDFAKNIAPGMERSEFAGATFSPDGKTLFFNLQRLGLTFAVWGPWTDGAL